MLNEVDCPGIIERDQALAVNVSPECDFPPGIERHAYMANLLGLAKYLIKSVKLALGRAIFHLLRVGIPS